MRKFIIFVLAVVCGCVDIDTSTVETPSVITDGERDLRGECIFGGVSICCFTDGGSSWCVYCNSDGVCRVV